MEKDELRELLARKSRVVGNCIIWAGAKLMNGYGIISPGGKQAYVHRVAYMLYVAPIPRNSCVLHSCDTPLCINPAHLRLGTPADNANDREQRGRGNHVKGEQNGKSKLTLEQVKEIKTRLKGTESFRRIARDYAVTDTTIQSIYTRRTWSHA